MTFDWEKDKIFFWGAFHHALYHEGLVGDRFPIRTIEIWENIPEKDRKEIIAAIKEIIAPAEEARISERDNPREVSQWKKILDLEKESKIVMKASNKVAVGGGGLSSPFTGDFETDNVMYRGRRVI